MRFRSVSAEPLVDTRGTVKMLKTPLSDAHARRKDFFLGSAISGFFQGSQNDFSRGSKSGEISFYPLEIKKTTFFLLNIQ